MAGVNQPAHWFLGDKDLGIQQRTSVWIGSPKSWFHLLYFANNSKSPRNFLASWCNWVNDRGDFWAQPVEVLVLAKSNRLHVNILRFSVIKWRYILTISLKWSVISCSLELQPVISQTQPLHFVTNCRFSPIIKLSDVNPWTLSYSSISNYTVP